MRDQRDKIAEWVAELGFGLEDLALEETAWAWGAVVTSDDGKSPVFVGQHQDDLRQVFLATAVQVSEEHLTAFDELGARARKAFLADLHLRLSDLPAVSLETEDEDEPRRMIFSVRTRLLDEDITRAKLYEATTRIQGAGTVVRLMFDKLVQGKS